MQNAGLACQQHHAVWTTWLVCRNQASSKMCACFAQCSAGAHRRWGVPRHSRSGLLGRGHRLPGRCCRDQNNAQQPDVPPVLLQVSGRGKTTSLLALLRWIALPCSANELSCKWLHIGPISPHKAQVTTRGHCKSRISNHQVPVQVPSL